MSRSPRKLTLRRERLVELSTAQLREVAGATYGDSCHITFYPCPTDIDCPTLPFDECLKRHGVDG